MTQLTEDRPAEAADRPAAARPVILTGDRTTGPLHLGHFAGSLEFGQVETCDIRSDYHIGWLNTYRIHVVTLHQVTAHQNL